MRYAQFYINSTGYVAGSIPPRFDAAHVKPIEVCGSDGVMRIDGRFGDLRAVQEARAMCKKRGFIGFSMHAGLSYMDSRTTRPYAAV